MRGQRVLDLARRECWLGKCPGWVKGRRGEILSGVYAAIASSDELEKKCIGVAGRVRGHLWKRKRQERRVDPGKQTSLIELCARL